METTKLNTQSHRRKQQLQLDDLPEAILLHILSLLPMEDTIRTSVLSRRWKHLWICIPTFNFTVPRSTSIITVNKKSLKEKAQVLDIIDRAFRFRDSSSLSAFHLHFYLEDLEDIATANSWITASSVRYKAERLFLFFGPSNIAKGYLHKLLPSCVFHDHLKELSLEFSRHCAYVAIKLPSPLILPCLKALHLKGVQLKDDKKLRKLFSLPTLEVLRINDCNCSSDLYISAPKLRELYLLEEYGGNTHQVLINGCSILEYFEYVGRRFCVSAPPLLTLTSALIHIDFLHMGWERSSDHTASLYKLLNGFSSVKYLDLSTDLAKALNSRIELLDRLPVFQNVSELKFGSGTGVVKFKIATLATILRCMPRLETLHFSQEVELSENVEERGCILDPIPWCCESHLKNIIILEFGSREEEWSILRILLRTARVLENIFLRILWSMPVNKHTSIYKKEVLSGLRELPRASEHCRFRVFKPCRMNTR